MLFNNYPKVYYPLTEDGKTVKKFLVTDITTRISLNMVLPDLLTMTSIYTLTPGETPESVSNTLYGTPDYYWTIMYINNKFDYIGDWCLSDEQILKQCETKYGADHINDPKHYEDEYGLIINPASAQLVEFNNKQTNVKFDGAVTLVTNYDYEIAQNEQKRKIYVVRIEYMTQFINNFNAELKKSQ